MSSRRGFSLRTFLADGRPDGLQTIEHSQWVGRGVVVPRHALGHHRSRSELSDPGIYLLSGPNPATGRERVYIGQTLDLRDRMSELENKDFWTRMLVFAADGPRLHRMHTDYIEARLIQLARERSGAELDNADAPRSGDIPEPDREDAEFFIDQMMLVAPNYGVMAFEKAPAKPRGAETLRINVNGASGSGYHAGAVFVVQSGSTTPRDEASSCPGHIVSTRKSLMDRGVLVEDGKQLKFTSDTAFESPAIAAMAVAASRAEAAAWGTGNTSRTTPGRDSDAGEDSGSGGLPGVQVKPIKARSAAS